ncbi:ATP-binding protein [Thiocapsa bogorovii]|uniref:ATP-binding protein n=1 Tax=Thiocapsa bogorovii TaxID=521689 RepID=UPI001E2D34F1|nr:ATP-binding protein [Thiocapsa bogorovii]UHD17627.1 ATP-binding protein [Thiocapsa bogorovii]
MSKRSRAPADVSLGAGASIVQRLFWLPLWLFVGLAGTVLVGILFVSWHSLQRLVPIEAHLRHIERIQIAERGMEQTLLSGLRGTRISPSNLQELGDEVRQIAAREGALDPQTPARLNRIDTQLGATQTTRPADLLFETLTEIRQVLDDERERHSGLLAQIGQDTRTEFKLTVVLLLAGPPVFGVALIFLRAHVKQPLRALEDLLGRLARKDYRPVPPAVIGEIDKVALPAFHSYNELVLRLQELECEHRDREQRLEQEVRRATEALLAQSREMARAERLAAVGAVSAGLAHELRNPLAGIQMACGKLHRALGDTEHAARIAAVIDELKRINQLLTSQVDAAHHVPEPLEVVAVKQLVDELLTLLRYQIPDRISITSHVPGDLSCLLPAAGLRQALLNLILNAVQAMPEQGHIQIAAGREDGALWLRVADTGPGFPQELLRAGIRPFATGRQGGTGLGLAMVRRFVRDHDGDLLLANQTSPHQTSDGAIVTLRLPYRPADTSGAPRYA